MRIWSRGLGKRELVMDLTKCEIAREGDRYILKGTVVEPVNWEFRITMEPEDVPGLIRTGASPGFIVIGLKWLWRTLAAPFSRDKEAPCWVRNPGCGTGRTMDCEPCPAYRARTPCWSFDWPSLQDPAVRATWGQTLAAKCPSCPVYAGHRDLLERARGALAGARAPAPAPPG
jgi:hypothetical protein